MAVKTSVMMRSRTTSCGQKGWPSTDRSFLTARRSRSIWAASAEYSERISLIDALGLGGAIAISHTSMGLRDPLDPDKDDVQADERRGEDGEQDDVQEVHPR